MDYDVIVIGAGPGGAITASAVAQAGYRVLMLERDAVCKSPCAGYVGLSINIEMPDDCGIKSKISKMRTYFPDLSYHDFQLNGFVVDRSQFDMSLVNKAEEAGAHIKWRSPLIDLVTDGVRFKGGVASGKIIVGSDGVFSKTSSILGIKKQRAAFCAQYHINEIKPLHNTSEIFFDADYAPGVYVWIYPTGPDSANVGLGITDAGSKSPHEYLDAFIKYSNISGRLDGKINKYVAGALPISGLREKLVYNNILLVGDSAGMADPVTGAGINNAMLAGEVAGNAIIRALENDDITLLGQYEARVRRLLARPLARSLEKRHKLDECCTQNELLQEHLPELWVTFGQYWD